MKLLRVLLLALLAVLLPVRGVMAAAMLCPPAAGQGERHAAPAGGDPVHDHAAHGQHAPADASAGTAQAHDHGAHHADSCNLCSSCCSVPPLASALPGLLPPHEQAAAAYPALSVPAPSFLSGGPERPPRSI